MIAELIEKAVLKNCDMRYANFHNADCRGTHFECTIMECSNYVFPDSFNPDRWMESTHGIHFWMTPEEAMAY